MHYLALDVRQEDCPLTRVTRDHKVTFTTPYWRFAPDSGRWELRIHADAPGTHELEAGLTALQDVETVHQFDLRMKRETTAFVQAVFDETTAIGTVTDHDGYVIGPFHNVSGREQWHLGFDTSDEADDALAELDRYEAFSVRDRRRIETPAEYDPFRNYETTVTLLNSCRQLTQRQREVLRTAIERGYYDTPRAVTLASLGAELGVSDVAVSKILRRAERTLLTSALSAADV